MATITYIYFSGGDLGELYRAYVERGLVYSNQAGSIVRLILYKGLDFFNLFWALLIWGIFTVTSAFAWKKRKWQGIFWLSAAIVPLIEPVLKIGFVYHFAVCLIGLGCFCATFWPLRWQSAGKLGKTCGIALIGLAFLQAIWNMPNPPMSWASARIFDHFPQLDWPKEAWQRLPALQAAAEVKK